MKEMRSMCKVIVRETNKDIDFILFNHLYSRKGIEFTIPDLIKELEVYHIHFSDKDIQDEIDDYLKRGFVSRRSGGRYECVTMI